MARTKHPTPEQAEAEKNRLHKNMAWAAMSPSFNSSLVTQTYQKNVFGKETEIHALVENLRDTFDDVKGGDMGNVEAMLIGQATALQSIFSNLAVRANCQSNVKMMESLLGLALKAQSQSRATLSALIDLKFPRQQATFVKQANIANGPQQVNNGGQAQIASHAEKEVLEQNKLLEDSSHGSAQMDTGATPEAKRGDKTVATLVKVNRPKKPRG